VRGAVVSSIFFFAADWVSVTFLSAAAAFLSAAFLPGGSRGGSQAATKEKIVILKS